MKNNKRSSFSLAVEITALILVFVIIIVGAGADSLKKGFDRSEYPRRYAKYVQSAAREFDIDENLIYAIIKAESKFDERALSSAGAMGLMQIMPETYEKDIKEKLGIESGADEALFDPEINIRCGAYYFSRWLDYFGDIETALAAYNAGFGNVRKWLSDERYSSDGKCIIPANIPFPETRSYVLRVTYYYGEYNKLYGAGSSSTSPPADTSSDNNNVTTAGSTGTSTAITDINNRPITWITRGPDERGRIFVNELACYAWAKEYHELYYGDIDPLLVMAIIKTESDFVVNAVSSAGAYGIMQIMPDTYYIDIKPSIDLSEDFEYLLEDPQFALKCGMYYLHWLYADSRGLNNSMINVIAAYHGGCNTVSAWLSTDGLSADGELIVSEIPIEKTAKYVEKVLANYEYYKTLFN